MGSRRSCSDSIMGSGRSCSDESSSPTTTTTTTTTTSTPTVAVAVRGSNSNGSKRAVRWAIENLMPCADRFVLVYVIPPITSIPAPSGSHMPINEMGADVVAMYKKEMRLQCEENFLPYKSLCKTKKMETLVLEDDNPTRALLKYISESSCKSFVLGSSSPNYITRKLKGEDVPTTILNLATNTCNIYVVSRSKLITKLASTDGTSAGQKMFNQTLHKRSLKQASSLHSASSSVSEADRSVEASSEVRSENYSQGSTDSDSFASVLADTQESIHEKFGNRTSGSQKFHDHHGYNDTLKYAKKREVHAEVEKLQIQLRTTLEMYDRACEDQVHIQQKVQALSSECVEEARKVHALLEREEMLRRTAAEEKVKHLEAIKKLEEAKQLLAKEILERQRAELNALTESSERQKVMDVLFSSDKRYRRYTKDDIEVATNFFSKAKMIGEGGYGKVYKCILDYTPVAIKVLQPDASEKTKKEEFLREVEVLSQLHHPNLVLLLGACPEIGCLVYEYMENGSLEERLFRRNGTPPLPWFVRFRIAFEVACGLTFLHNSEPEPIVHRDMKPGNILLDRNYGSKIGDVGLSKLMSAAVPDNITEYRNSSLAGTLNYMDPEYHRTGTLRPKSDVYAFGLIILQLLTARRPNRLVVSVENAINNISLSDILDKSVADWPLAEAEELAQIALKCCRIRCRDRPDLESEVLPVLEKLSNIADAIVRLQKGNTYAPSHYFCPILQEVMEDPYVAADGFTYEYIAIKEWLGKNKVSPVTKLMLPHTMLTPNHTLRFAIEEWKKRRTCSSF